MKSELAGPVGREAANRDKYKCVPITCDDGMKDSLETDIDCGHDCGGGPCCP